MEEKSIINNNVLLLEILEDELKHKHSLAAFMQLLEMGREFEFVYNSTIISVTHLEGKLLYSDPVKYHYYDDVWSVVIKTMVDDKYFVECWNQMELRVMF